MAKIPINIATGTLQKEDIIVGIDLGTTNSLIAVVHPQDGQAKALKEVDGYTIVPSVLHIDKEGNFQVGHDALPFLETDATNTIYSIKRLMGKSYQDIESDSDFFSYDIINNSKDELIKLKVGNVFYSPIELSSKILSALKSRAEHILKTSVNRCVITVPAYFNDAQRQATRDAGKLAGLEVLRIINEPTAASLAYGFGKNSDEEKVIAVYDLGGGTFDVSILRIQEGVFEVLSTHGDTNLGGDDYDRAIFNLLAKKLGLSVEKLNSNKERSQSLRLIAEECKKKLSSKNELNSQFENQEFTLSRAEFKEATKEITQRTINSCKQALEDSKLNLSEIDEVLMVGGSSRIPAVREAVENFFEQTPNTQLNPDEVVAVGAAIQADILAGNTTDMLLLDVTPLSLGIETMGGLMEVLISRNSKIPTQVAKEYTTQKDGQSGMEISVYQGERDLVQFNRRLAKFSLNNIPGMPAGLPKVQIKFTLDADGILRVQAKELRSGVSQDIEVKPQYGLTDEEVEEMLLASLTNAKEDIASRALIEAQSEGKQLISQTEQFIKKHAEYIEEEEKEASYKAIEGLKSKISSTDKNEILQAIEELNHSSTQYAQRVMDIAVQHALKGKNI